MGWGISFALTFSGQGALTLFSDGWIHTHMKHIQLYENFGIEVEPYEIPTQIECNRCGWNWNSLDSEPADMYVCHKCGADNKVYYEGEPDDDDELPPVGSGKTVIP